MTGDTVTGTAGEEMDASVAVSTADAADSWWIDLLGREEYLDSEDVVVTGLPDGLNYAVEFVDGGILVHLSGTPAESGTFTAAVQVADGLGAGDPTALGMDGRFEVDIAAGSGSGGSGSTGGTGSGIGTLPVTGSDVVAPTAVLGMGSVLIGAGLLLGRRRAEQR